ncbi:MAG: hypothetical protein A2W25_10425 [candidate division Zixibacteria bacterium RBG_16_53_22]|nr:MAG: hypothetical protein A2W25_10425 [candidate division Zixibacteria bacterium RBG_16_53_22]
MALGNRVAAPFFTIIPGKILVDWLYNWEDALIKSHVYYKNREVTGQIISSVHGGIRAINKECS